MADNTKIEWTDATWNPITGCKIVSPGCTNCYAMKLAGTRLAHHPSRAGLTLDTKAGPVWNGKLRFNSEWIEQPLRWKRPRRIFVCAHGDLFAEGVETHWLDQIFAIMALCPHHIFQVLTKRPERMRAYLEIDPDVLRDRWFRSIPSGEWRISVSEAYARLHPHASEEMRKLYNCTGPIWPLPNVWLGVSIEDQARADERIPYLLSTPAAVHWISAEPLLGPVDIRDALANPKSIGEPLWQLSRIDWVVAGGESGANARPIHPDWARSLRDQCAEADVPFFFKQWGEWAPQVGAIDGWALGDDPEVSRFDHRDWENDHWGEPYRPAWCDDIEDDTVSRIGKRNAGRLLDGIEHNAMPRGEQ